MKRFVCRGSVVLVLLLSGCTSKSKVAAEPNAGHPSGSGGSSGQGGSSGETSRATGSGGDAGIGGAGATSSGSGGMAGEAGSSGTGGDTGSGGETGAGGSGGGTGGTGGSGTGGNLGSGGTGGEATGGVGGNGGGAGAPPAPDPCDQLIEDEGLSCSTLGDVTHEGEAFLEPGCHSFGALTISTGAVTVNTVPGSGPTTIIADTVEIGVDGFLGASFQGYGAGQGPGAGEGGTLYGGGAGHGGGGGDKNISGGPTLLGGDTYGDAMYPITAGSGGGIGGPNTGGAGGGAIRICAREYIHIDGRVASRGESTGLAGAGAAGSILLMSPGITGAGRLIAIGGTASGVNCGSSGGSGGGGRVALRTDSDDYQGTIEIQGGGGCNPGETGTSYRSALP